MTDGSRPPDAVDQRAVHVTPEVVCPIITLLIHQPETTADHLQQHKHILKRFLPVSSPNQSKPSQSDLFNHSYPSPTQVSLIHHLHPHLLLKGKPHALLHLKTKEKSFQTDAANKGN